ncbi:MAG TPA: hypothetical protein VF342_16365 [Alphaproteobacteria bacterium]
MKLHRWLLGASVLALGACSTIQSHETVVEVKPEVMNAYLSDKPASLHPYYERVLLEGERNAVLNHMRFGLAAYEVGAFDTAEASFDEALLRIEAIYADNEKAEAARSLWTKENIKDFKGEPYERVMAYYYRGLLYLREGDYENARASFKGGMLQDTWAEEEKYQADFALMAFLEGWSSRCLGKESAAQESFNEAKQHRAAFDPPPPDHNVLLIAEIGTSPVKVARGDFNERLEYERGQNFSESGATFRITSRGKTQTIDAQLLEGLYWQASTRGGRQVQAILDGKAQFKDATDTAGEVAMTAGTSLMTTGVYSNSNDTAMAGAAMIFVGLIAKGIAAATRPEADIRYWDNLPDTVHVATMKAPAAPYSVDVQFKNADGSNAGPERKVEVTQAGACSIGWTRSHAATSIDVSAPGAVAQR